MMLSSGIRRVIAAFRSRLVGQPRSTQPQRWIEVDHLATRIKEDVVLIDVRSPDEFTGPLGHIANARNVPLTELAGRLDELDAMKSSPVVLVCRTDKRSASAASLLQEAGFRDVQVLRGGMELWNRSGPPVEGRATTSGT